MTETVQRGSTRESGLSAPKLTDCASVLIFTAHGGCDVRVLSTSMNIEPGDAGTAEHLVLQLITATSPDAVKLAAHHRLTEDPDLAARLRPGTQMWSGWLTSETSSTPVRCVLYAQARGSR